MNFTSSSINVFFYMLQDIRDHLRGIHEAMLQFSQIQERLFSSAILEVEKRQVNKINGSRIQVDFSPFSDSDLGEIQIDYRDLPPQYQSKTVCHQRLVPGKRI